MSIAEGDNGKPAAEKTKEQLDAERLERYKASPGSFIELSEIVLCVIKNDESSAGISCFLGKCKRSVMAQSKTEIDHLVEKKLMEMDIKAEMDAAQKQNMLLPQRGGILDFVRGHRQ